MARDFTLPAMLAAGDRLAAVCDPDPAARAHAASLGARAYATVEELAADPSVEAVYVATPNHLHRPMVEALARAGKAVLCEKPLAHTLDDAAAMIAAVERSAPSTAPPSTSATTPPTSRSATRCGPAGSAPSRRCASSTAAGSAPTGPARRAATTGGSTPPRPAAAP